jgi:gas vesicle protein
MGGLFGGKTTLASGAYVQGGQAFSAAGKPLTGAAANSVITAAGKQGRGFGAFSPKSMGAGLGLGMGGMALSGIASSMEPGAGANTVGVLGQTAQYAGMGMMFGPWGAAIGGLVGLGMGLFSLSKENEERRKQEADASKESQRRTQEIIEQMSVRPIELNVTNETIGKWNTYSSQNGANNSFA